MDALLAQLERGARGNRRPAVVTICLVALVGAAVIVQRHRERLCQGAEQKLVEVWEATRPRVRPGPGALGVGRAHVGLKHFSEALPLLERARKILSAANSRPDYRIAVDVELARPLWEAGRDRAQAVALMGEARDFYAEPPTLRASLQIARKWLATHQWANTSRQ
jgi:hypothetical protein